MLADGQTHTDANRYYNLFYAICYSYGTDNEMSYVYFAAVNHEQPYRELFVWAVAFDRIRMAKFFWKICPDQIGSALVASMIFKSLADEAKTTGKLLLAEELRANSGLDIVFCCCFASKHD